MEVVFSIDINAKRNSLLINQHSKDQIPAFLQRLPFCSKIIQQACCYDIPNHISIQCTLYNKNCLYINLSFNLKLLSVPLEPPIAGSLLHFPQKCSMDFIICLDSQVLPKTMIILGYQYEDLVLVFTIVVTLLLFYTVVLLSQYLPFQVIG